MQTTYKGLELKDNVVILLLRRNVAVKTDQQFTRSNFHTLCPSSSRFSRGEMFDKRVKMSSVIKDCTAFEACFPNGQ